MSTRSFVAIALVLPVLTAATYLPYKGAGPSTAPKTPIHKPTPPNNTLNQCNTGPIHCCNSLQSASSSNVIGLFSLIGTVVEAPDTLVGTNCSPVTTLGTGSASSCSSQPVCCTNNHFNGLIVVGCTPINL